jgi:hypothetical protein
MLHGVVDNQVKSEKGRRRPVFECRASELGEYIFKLPTVMFHSLQRLHYILASFSSAGVITQEVGVESACQLIFMMGHHSVSEY